MFSSAEIHRPAILAAVSDQEYGVMNRTVVEILKSP